ncbi:MAG: hypothetical protein K0Q72_4290 [Armatimonadetes bacterium]|nr:hypothetical protein [Armatimonadota bacterium]
MPAGSAKVHLEAPGDTRRPRRHGPWEVCGGRVGLHYLGGGALRLFQIQRQRHPAQRGAVAHRRSLGRDARRSGCLAQLLEPGCQQRIAGSRAAGGQEHAGGGLRGGGRLWRDLLQQRGERVARVDQRGHRLGGVEAAGLGAVRGAGGPHNAGMPGDGAQRMLADRFSGDLRPAPAGAGGDQPAASLHERLQPTGRGGIHALVRYHQHLRVGQLVPEGARTRLEPAGVEELHQARHPHYRDARLRLPAGHPRYRVSEELRGVRHSERVLAEVAVVGERHHPSVPQPPRRDHRYLGAIALSGHERKRIFAVDPQRAGNAGRSDGAHAFQQSRAVVRGRAGRAPSQGGGDYSERQEQEVSGTARGSADHG